MRGLMVLVLLGACATAASSTGQRYAVYFQEWSAALDNGGSGAVAQAAAEAGRHATEPVRVVGFADPTGSAQANRDLSRTRAQVVADALAANGVARDRIHLEAAGATGYTMDAQESRRVTISIGNP